MPRLWRCSGAGLCYSDILARVHVAIAALIGASLFGEEPDAWTWIGAAVIFGATLTVVRSKASQTRSG